MGAANPKQSTGEPLLWATPNGDLLLGGFHSQASRMPRHDSRSEETVTEPAPRELLIFERIRAREGRKEEKHEILVASLGRLKACVPDGSH